MATTQDLEQFVSSVTLPEDFEAFWRGVTAELAEIPLEPRIWSMPLRSNKEVSVFEVTYRSLGGLEIAAWYSVPTEGHGPFPAIVRFPGYKGEPRLPREWGRKGVVALSVAVRGKLRSNAQFNPGYPGLLTHGIESRDTYSYKGIISDCIRGVDFLLSRSEVDPDRILACGSSQGGGLTLIAAALRPEIKAAVAAWPFLSSIPDAIRMVSTYPYDELNCFAAANPEGVTQMLSTLRYYDLVNFARWVSCPTAMGIPMSDDICPPETCYAAYRNLAGPKDLWLFPNEGHGNARDYPAKETAWLEGMLAIANVGEVAR